MVDKSIADNDDNLHSISENSHTTNDNQYDIDIIDRDPIVLCRTIVVHLSDEYLTLVREYQLNDHLTHASFTLCSKKQQTMK